MGAFAMVRTREKWAYYCGKDAWSNQSKLFRAEQNKGSFVGVTASLAEEWKAKYAEPKVQPGIKKKRPNAVKIMQKHPTWEEEREEQIDSPITAVVGHHLEKESLRTTIFKFKLSCKRQENAIRANAENSSEGVDGQGVFFLQDMGLKTPQNRRNCV